jgi:hypothetical protein
MAQAIAKNARSTGWRLIAALLLLAFVVQSYVAQTHMHDAAQVGVSIGKTNGHDSPPLENSPLDCPFCQAVAHDSGFFVPTGPLLFLSAQWMEMAPPHVLIRDSASAPVHDWKSRAPPRLTGSNALS